MAWLVALCLGACAQSRRRAEVGCMDAGCAPDAGAGLDADATADADVVVRGRCGDGLVNTHLETCDDGNAVDDDGCNVDCRIPGQLIWQHYLDTDVVPLTIAVDERGEIVVGGFTIAADGTTDLWINRYDTQGQAVWAAARKLDAGDDEQAKSLAFAGNGDLVVAGESHPIEDRRDSSVLLMRYAGSDGAPLWSEPRRAKNGGAHTASHVLVTAMDRAHVLGSHKMPNGTGLWAQAYDASGAPLWPRPIAELAGVIDTAQVLAVDRGGALRVAWATFLGLSEERELLFGKIGSADGSLEFTRVALGTGAGVPSGWAAGADAVLVAMRRASSPESADLWLQKYDWTGTPQWPTPIVETGKPELSSPRVALDSAGNIAVLSVLVRDAYDRKLWLRRYAPDGRALWSEPALQRTAYEDIGGAVGFDPSGNVVMAGALDSPVSSSQLWLAKYAR